MERDEAITQLSMLVGKDLRELANQLGVTVFNEKNSSSNLNKGWAGHVVERYLGIPINSAQSPNLGTWELKVIPLEFKYGTLRVKETMAITMLDPAEIMQKSFHQSHLYMKLRKLIIVSRIYADKSESKSIVHSCNSFELEGTTLFDQVEQDYYDIRSAVCSGDINSKIGKYVQARTKGPGHGSTSRAFYARKELVEHIIGLKACPPAQQAQPCSVELIPPPTALVQSFLHSLPSDTTGSTTVARSTYVSNDKKSSDCPKHAGPRNKQNRTDGDDMMSRLPHNQSGSGRHKCPYCAYEIGFNAGVAAKEKELDAIKFALRRLLENESSPGG